MQGQRNDVATALTWMAGITSISVTLLLPLGFLATEYAELTESLTVEARMQAVIVSHIVARNPRVWKYESERLKEGLQEFQSPKRSIHILDMEGNKLAELGEHSTPPTIVREAEFYDYGVPAGRIVTATSLLPALNVTGMLLALSTLLGFVVFVPLRQIPLLALQRSNTALASTNQEYRTLVEGLTDGLLLVDKAGVIIAANPSAAHMLCRPGEPLVSSNIVDLLSSAVRENGSPFDKATWAHFSAHTWGQYSERLSIRIAEGDGKRMWLLMRSRFTSIPDGESARIAVRLEDITHRKQLEELRELNAQLEQRIEERTVRLEQVIQELETFTHVVAHDLRSPLAYIGHLCETLQSKHRVEDNDGANTALGAIQHEARAMSGLIDELLSLAQIRRQELQFVQVDLSALAWQAVDRLAITTPSRAVKFNIADGLHARVDAGMMRTALQDLFSNAWKFTEHTAEARIEFGSRTDNEGGIVYFVHDNGVGFDPSLAGKLFMPFQRLHNPSEFAGSGIGLARTRRIIERHNGRIWAEGRTGAGATFFFTLHSQGNVSRS